MNVPTFCEKRLAFRKLMAAQSLWFDVVCEHVNLLNLLTKKDFVVKRRSRLFTLARGVPKHVLSAPPRRGVGRNPPRMGRPTPLALRMTQEGSQLACGFLRGCGGWCGEARGEAQMLTGQVTRSCPHGPAVRKKAGSIESTTVGSFWFTPSGLQSSSAQSWASCSSPSCSWQAG